MSRKLLWISADPDHISQIATWTHDDPEYGLLAHFSAAAVAEIRDHAQETRPSPCEASGREEVIRLSFDGARTRTAFALAVIELGGQIVPQMLLPSAASLELVP